MTTFRHCDRYTADVNAPPELSPAEDWRIAQKQQRLDALRAKLVAVQAAVLAEHRVVANLCDAVGGLEAAIADVDLERERLG